MTRIADIFEIPKQVHQGDFVLRLTEGVVDAEGTLKKYVVTPELKRSFDQALSLINSAVEAHSSKGAYLHGSFGSGKSHFMAVLTLLLNNNPDARSVPELAEVIKKHNEWTSKHNFLVVPYHMIGARSMEEAVLGGYVNHVRRAHPDAPTPPVYQSEALFKDARKLRKSMGDEAFFYGLSDGAGGDDDGWGDLSGGWDAESFEAAMAAEPGSELRGRLVSDLVDNYFEYASRFAGDDGEGFVSLDEGLSVISKHAHALGYTGLVLFLDELILWLASHATDEAFVNREGQKVAKLVESTEADRPIPIVSFIARQRDLRELVSANMGGMESVVLGEVMKWWEARFDKITLEDRNLPAIVERRLLAPKSKDARNQVDSAFEKAANERDSVLQTLLTRDFTREQFRQVYPFSPVLVKVLVALSALLQRERTALKLMLQLLVNQRDELELGDIVPVGDLYDVLAGGDEPFSQAMRIHFDNARRLYRQRMLPLLARAHGVTAEQIEYDDLDDTKKRQVRTDARLMKTLLLAALADGVEELQALTPARLAALNHGSVKSPIPGQEATVVLNKCRQWAGQIGEIKITDDGNNNATISLHLVGVDTDGILQNAQTADNPGSRARLIKEMLYEDLGVADTENLLRAPLYKFPWRGTPREAEVQVIRPEQLPPDNFAPSEAEWKVVIGLPTGGSVADDRAKVQELQTSGEAARTIVWLPSGFSARGDEDLRRLVVLDHVLTGSRLQDDYGKHLTQSDREQARTLLRNQRDQLRQRVRSNLLTAYGISTVNPDAVENDPEQEQHFFALSSGLSLQSPVGSGFGESLTHLLSQALSSQYPAHPDFAIEVKRSALRKVLEVVQRGAATPGGRVEVAREDRDLMRGIAVPLELGQMGDTHFVLGDYWATHFQKYQDQQGVQQVTVRRLRQWMDEPEARGLPEEVGNLVILSFAEQSNRRLFLHSGPAEAKLERLEDAMELHEQALPDEASWNKALERAGHLFGEAPPAARNASNVGRLSERLRSLANERHEAVSRYLEQLKLRLRQLEVESGDSQRLASVNAAQAVLSAIRAAGEDEVVEALARAELPNSVSNVGTEIAQAGRLADLLTQSGTWDIFGMLVDLGEDWSGEAATVMDTVREGLRRDELALPLAEQLRLAYDQAKAILQRAMAQAQKKKPAEKAQPEKAAPGARDAKRRGSCQVAVGALDEAVTALREAVADAPQDAEIELQWTIHSAADAGDEGDGGA